MWANGNIINYIMYIITSMQSRLDVYDMEILFIRGVAVKIFEFGFILNLRGGDSEFSKCP